MRNSVVTGSKEAAETGNREQATGNNLRETGRRGVEDRRLETGVRKVAATGRRVIDPRAIDLKVADHKVQGRRATGHKVEVLKVAGNKVAARKEAEDQRLEIRVLNKAELIGRKVADDPRETGRSRRVINHNNLDHRNKVAIDKAHRYNVMKVDSRAMNKVDNKGKAVATADRNNHAGHKVPSKKLINHNGHQSRQKNKIYKEVINRNGCTLRPSLFYICGYLCYL